MLIQTLRNAALEALQVLVISILAACLLVALVTVPANASGNGPRVTFGDDPVATTDQPAPAANQAPVVKKLVAIKYVSGDEYDFDYGIRDYDQRYCIGQSLTTSQLAFEKALLDTKQYMIVNPELANEILVVYTDISIFTLNVGEIMEFGRSLGWFGRSRDWFEDQGFDASIDTLAYGYYVKHRRIIRDTKTGKKLGEATGHMWSATGNRTGLTELGICRQGQYFSLIGDGKSLMKKTVASAAEQVVTKLIKDAPSDECPIVVLQPAGKASHNRQVASGPGERPTAPRPRVSSRNLDRGNEYSRRASEEDINRGSEYASH